MHNAPHSVDHFVHWSPAYRMSYSKRKDENTYDSNYECMAKKQEKKTVQNHIREPKGSI